jgi:hypothetical protein
MDRRTFVKAGCIGSASLLMQGLDPMIRAESPTAVPPVELRGLADYKPSPLGMLISSTSHRDPRSERHRS